MTNDTEIQTAKTSKTSAQVRCHRRKTQRMADKGKLATNAFLSAQAKAFLDHGVQEIDKLGLQENYADGAKVYTEEMRGTFIEHLIGFYKEMGGPLAESAPSYLSLVATGSDKDQEVPHVG